MKIQQIMIPYCSMIMTATLLIFGSTANANLFINGDFEVPDDVVVWSSTTPEDFPEGWGPNYEAYLACPAELQTGYNAIGGTGSSALLHRIARRNGSMLSLLSNPTGQEWEFDMDLACTYPTVENRALQLFLGHELVGDDGKIIVQIEDADHNGIGSIKINDGSGYIPIFEEVFPFSFDVVTEPIVNHLKVIGDYTETPTYKVILTAGGVDYESEWQTGFVGSVPSETNQGLVGVALQVGYIDAEAFTLVDNLVAVGNGVQDDPIPGDANEDGKVDGSDVTILANHWQEGVATGGDPTVEWSMGDFNGDHMVDGSDVTILANHWQEGVTATTASVPEPGSIVLILTTILSVVFFRKWRK